MPNKTADTEKLIQEMLETAETLEKFASDDSLYLDKTASITAPESSGRKEYMQGVLSALGIED